MPTAILRIRSASAISITPSPFISQDDDIPSVGSATPRTMRIMSSESFVVSSPSPSASPGMISASVNLAMRTIVSPAYGSCSHMGYSHAN